MILEKGLLFQHLVRYSHPKMPEIRGNNMLNCERSTGPFPEVTGFDILFTFLLNFKFEPGLKLVMQSQQNSSPMGELKLAM